ncbi:hypothetical protein BDZ89DRAFT_769328 [Hymenopellis radicata]|nr:hypothetical protein BDZ89DRAFT_769328 [Hymenopellis radicata]
MIALPIRRGVRFRFRWLVQLANPTHAHAAVCRSRCTEHDPQGFSIEALSAICTQSSAHLSRDELPLCILAALSQILAIRRTFARQTTTLSSLTI